MIQPQNRVFNFFFIFLFLSFLTMPFFSYGKEKIRISDKNLEKETIFPIFQSKDVLKDRLIRTKGRLELGIGMGLDTTEAIYNNVNFSANVIYHLSEVHAVNLFASMMRKGWGVVGDGIYTGKAFGASGNKFARPQMSKVPYKAHMFWLNYQYTPYYGKISLTKNIVAHLAYFSLIGIGTVGFNDNSYEMGFNLGLGQKIYFTKRMGLRFSVKFIGHLSPDITSTPEGYSTEELEAQDPVVIQRDKYKSVLSINSIININFTFLI